MKKNEGKKYLKESVEEKITILKNSEENFREIVGGKISELSKEPYYFLSTDISPCKVIIKHGVW